ncbi:hypothetical protein GCM10027615_57270 [Plantactinospora veratri]
MVHRDADLTRLAGHVVPAGGPLDPAEVRAHAAEALPDYMVPSAVLVLDGPLPLTANGKLDRRALPAPDWAALTGDDAPVSPAEQRIADLVAEVLRLPSVGTSDNFFALGGHSMAAMRLLGRIRAVLGVDLAVRDIFEAPTVAGLADRLAGAVAERPALRPVGDGAAPVAAPVQQTWWDLHRAGAERQPSGRTGWDLALAVRAASGPGDGTGGAARLDVPALKAALADLAQRHEPLRTALAAGAAGEPVPVPVVDRELLEVLPETGVPLDDRVAELVGDGVDPTREPPLRARLLTGPGDDRVLLLTMHYLGVDEWSVVPLARDLGTAYAARLAGRTPEWAPLPVGYPDYARWAGTLLGDPADPGSRQARQLDWWRDALSGVPDRLALPTDRPRPAALAGRGGRVEFTLDAATHRAVDELARQTGTSMFMVFQAALAALLHRVGAGPDVPIGTLVAGRTEAALGDLVGCFVNPLVLRTDTGGDPTFTELLGRIREADLSAFDRQDVPFHAVRRLLPAGATLPQVMLVHHEEAGLDGPDDVAALRFAPVPTGTTRAELTVSFYEPLGDGPVHGELEYAVELFEPATARRLTDELLGLLASALARPGLPLSALGPDPLGPAAPPVDPTNLRTSS